MTIEVYSKKDNKIKITFPTKKNGSAVAKLIQRCPPLDLNSTYHYLIQSHYFNRTCSLAFEGEKVIAFVSGFIKPTNKNCLFIWQVAIDEGYRGKGFGIELIEFLLNQNKDVNTIETTITKNNTASRRMFQKIVEKYETEISEGALFDKEEDFSSEHDSEILITIGPLKKGKK
jgi:L-2,4-diaminobutyric acid acetyltransferase